MKKYLSILLPFLLLYCCAKAQQSEAMSELQKIKAYYAGPELKHVAGQMLLKNITTTKQVDKVDFEYWAKGKQIFTKMNFIEILNNNEVYVMVNNRKKTIYGRPQAQVTQKNSTGFFDPDQLNALLNTKGAVVTVTKGAALNKLSMSGLQNTRFASVVISYSTANYKIIAVTAMISPVQGANQKLVLEVKYTVNNKTTIAGEPPVFSAAKYITKNNKGNYIYTKTYQNYQKL